MCHLQQVVDFAMEYWGGASCVSAITNAAVATQAQLQSKDGRAALKVWVYRSKYVFPFYLAFRLLVFHIPWFVFFRLVIIFAPTLFPI